MRIADAKQITLRTKIYLLVLAIISIALHCWGITFQLTAFGFEDFFQLWSEYQLISNGRDPYNTNFVGSFYRTYSFPTSNIETTLRPPWVYSLFSLILRNSYNNAKWLWFGWNSVLALLSIIVLIELRFKSATFYLLATVTPTILYFYPGWEAVRRGQGDIVLILAVSFMHVCLVRRKWFKAGMWMAFFTMKPFLFFLLPIPVVIWSIRQNNYSIIKGFFTCLGLLILISLIQYPMAYRFWIEGFGRQLADITLVAEATLGSGKYANATLSGFLRVLWYKLTGQQGVWIAVLVTVAAIAVTIKVELARSSKFIKWRRVIPTLIAFSVMCAPFGRSFEASILMILHAETILRALRGERTDTIFLVLTSQVAMYWYGNVIALNNQHQLFWFPLLTWLIFALHSKSLM